MITALLAWIAAKFSGVSFRAIIIVLTVLCVGIGGFLAYRHVTNLAYDLAAKTAEVATEKLKRDLADATNAALRKSAAMAERRLEQLEEARTVAETEAQLLREQFRTQTDAIKKEFDRDPAEAARGLRDRAARLNRMLERSSRGED